MAVTLAQIIPMLLAMPGAEQDHIKCGNLPEDLVRCSIWKGSYLS